MKGAGQLATLIKIYTDKMKHAADYNESHKLRYELGDKVGELDLADVQKEIIAYISENLVTKAWVHAHEWIGSVLNHPSPAYIDYLLQILDEEDTNAPHYWALDAIEYMPEEMTELAIPGLKQRIEPINPSWSYAVIEKYFETIVWNDEDAEKFISSFVDSPNEMVAFRAKYWMETFEVESEEDAEGED
ncbi:hypothetical protein AV654_01900 [Paenibacillus elgii]|uniref:HEAT repeat domain-containing protein n=1 Tax=Paenibacillus elgii TaxID=189691 RepID=A0A161S2H8_9BACL|nr:hypothetical protein [Paenibacillus elgii]KZE78534.1 hypothetical protein AV654_01900 [Paenibacillus elgii]